MNDRNDSGAAALDDDGAALEGVRHDLAARLPNLIGTALARYRDFTTTDPPSNPKGFAAYNTACRAALGHLDQLVKLTRWAMGEAPVGLPPDEGVDRLIAQAEAALEEATADT